MFTQNKSLNFGQYTPNDKVLNKKVPENPKYKNVKSVINTGRNVKRLIDDLREQQLNIGYKRDEVFMRIKFLSFVSLAANVAKLALNPPQVSTDDEEIVEDKNEKYNQANVLVGIGEIDVRNAKNNPPPPVSKPELQAPYLLLDIRDREQFIESHLKTAKHYPSALISRSIGYEIEEMKQYKNSSNIIILYDEDESIVPKVATTLVERGYNNIYVLTGGWKLGAKILPKKLWALITTERMNASSLGSCGMVQIKTNSGQFTKEDISSIELYVDPVPVGKDAPLSDALSTGDNLSSSHFMEVASKKESSIPKTDGSLTYRKGSAGAKSTCSLSSKEVPRSQRVSRSCLSIHDGRMSAKKVPWK